MLPWRFQFFLSCSPLWIGVTNKIPWWVQSESGVDNQSHMAPKQKHFLGGKIPTVHEVGKNIGVRLSTIDNVSLLVTMDVVWGTNKDQTQTYVALLPFSIQPHVHHLTPYCLHISYIPTNSTNTWGRCVNKHNYIIQYTIVKWIVFVESTRSEIPKLETHLNWLLKNPSKPYDFIRKKRTPVWALPKKTGPSLSPFQKQGGLGRLEGSHLQPEGDFPPVLVENPTRFPSLSLSLSFSVCVCIFIYIYMFSLYVYKYIYIYVF